MAKEENQAAAQYGGTKGEIRIADDVVSVIAGLAAMEIDGVDSMGGNITRDLISKINGNNLSKGVKVEMEDGVARVRLTLNLKYGYSVMDVSKKVQERVKTSIENMTGFHVEDVAVRVIGIAMETEE